MNKVNVFEVKARFAEYLERAASGERIVIYRYNKPVAELRALGASRAEPRPVGPVAGRPTFALPSSFFEPMSDEELRAWEDQGAGDPVTSAFPPAAADADAWVAEGPSARPAAKAPRARRRRS